MSSFVVLLAIGLLRSAHHPINLSNHFIVLEYETLDECSRIRL